MACRAILRAIALAAWVVVRADGHAKLRLQAERALAHERRHRQPAPKHRLRVCNAYPYSTPLNVYIGASGGMQRLTDPPMAYKTCREFEPQLHVKDRIDFRFQEASAGTFVVGDLPSTDAVLMLVVYRHNTQTTAVAFESHVFANLLNAQIAVLDTYRGPAKAQIKIQDAEDATTSRSEPLAFGSVVALNQGKYEVVLAGLDGLPKSRSNLTIGNRESCVVIRSGVDPAEGRSYPQELIVYPVHPPEKGGMLRSSARSSLMPLLTSIVCVCSALSAAARFT